MSEDLHMAEGNGLDELDFPGDPSKLPTVNELPLGVVEVKIGVGTPGFTKEATEPGKVGGYARVSIQFIMTDHPNQQGYAGMMVTQGFFIGSKEDPKAAKWGTWARNAVLLMSMFEKAGVAFGQGTRLREALKAAEGQVVLAEVALRGGKNPQYADEHVIKRFHRVGTKEVQLREGAASADARAAADPELAAAFSGVSNED